MAKKRPPAKVPDQPPPPKPVIPPQVVQRRQEIRCTSCGSHRVQRIGSYYDRGVVYFRCMADCVDDSGNQTTFKLPVA